MGKVMAVCISEKKGTQKRNVHEALFIEDFGLEMMPMQVNGIAR